MGLEYHGPAMVREDQEHGGHYIKGVGDLECGSLNVNDKGVQNRVLDCVGLYAGNLTAVTSIAKAAAYYQYVGRVTNAITTATVRARVTTAYGEAGVGTKGAEVGVYKGTLNAGSDPGTLTLLGSTDVSGTYNSTGLKTTSVTLSGVSSGDDLWVAFGSSPGSLGIAAQLRGVLADDLQSGVFAIGSLSAGALQATDTPTLAGATIVPGWVKVIV